MKRQPRVLLSALTCAVAIAAACSSCKKSPGSAAAKEDMALVPPETSLVFNVNLGRLRSAAVWKKVTDLRDQSPEQKKTYDEFVARTGLDPLKQIESAFVAFPTASAESTGEFGAVVRGGPFDEQKLVEYAKEQLKKGGQEMAVSEYAGKKLYSDGRGQTVAVFLDGKTMLVGGKGWIKKMVDLAGKGTGESAQKNLALVALVKKTHTGDALWAAGLIPEEVRTQFRQNPKLGSAGSMKDAYGSVDFASGFSLTGAVDLGSESDAKDLAGKLTEQVTEAKKNPQMQLLGMAQYLDAVKVSSEAAALHLEVKLNNQQVDDLIGRLQGLLRSLGAAGAPQGQLNPSP